MPCISLGRASTYPSLKPALPNLAQPFSLFKKMPCSAHILNYCFLKYWCGTIVPAGQKPRQQNMTSFQFLYIREDPFSTEKVQALRPFIREGTHYSVPPVTLAWAPIHLARTARVGESYFPDLPTVDLGPETGCRGQRIGLDCPDSYWPVQRLCYCRQPRLSSLASYLLFPCPLEPPRPAPTLLQPCDFGVSQALRGFMGRCPVLSDKWKGSSKKIPHPAQIWPPGLSIWT